MFTFPEKYKLVLLNNSAANAVTSDYICCKNAHKVWFLIFHAGANDTDLTFSLKEAVDVAETGGSSAVVATFPIWVDIDASTTSDLLIKQTDAASFAIDPATMNPVLLILEWDPAKHTAGYDCIAVADGGAGGHANNTVQIFAIIEERYPAGQPPTAITD
jgi:hypothetical protein